jgi:hypothetical protein
MILLNNPVQMNDVNSWVFFGIGLIFSLIAMCDGLLFTDPYFGYGAVEKQCLEAQDQYKDTKSELVERLRDIRDAASEAMNSAARDLSVRRGEYDAILQARARLAQRFMEHQNHIERTARALFSIYREANQQARSAAVPGYFSKPYNLERIIYASAEVGNPDRERLGRAIAETQELLKSQIQAVHEAFDEAVRSYREIDDFVPESNGGSASTKAA